MHDRYITNFDTRSRHSTKVEAPPDRVWPLVRRLDVSRSPIIRTLFSIRGLGNVRSLADVERIGFRILEEEPPDFLGIGVVGRPWEGRGDLEPIDDPVDWVAFAEPGYAKISWTFILSSPGAGLTDVSTETRVVCTDERSRRRFARYWRVVGPFSGLTRREMLRGIKREAEADGVAGGYS